MEQKNSITQSCFVSCDTNSTGRKLNLGIQTTLEADTSFISTGVITKLFGNITMDPAFCPRSWPFWLCCVVLAGEPNSKIFHRNKYQKKKYFVLVLSKGKSVVPLVHVTQVESVRLKGSVSSCKASPAWLGGWHQLHEGSTVMPSGFVQEWGLHQNGTFTGKMMIHQPGDSGVPEFPTDANLEIWGHKNALDSDFPGWTLI